MIKIRHIASLLTITASLGIAGTAAAQPYPNKPIRFVVASSAGTTADNLARVMAQEMTKTLGQPIVIENKPGAQMIIALEYIISQPADGYTVGITGTDAMALLPHVAANLRFNPTKDVVPIASLAEARYAWVGITGKPWKTFNELIAYARANPGKINYGSSAPQTHFPTLVIIDQLKINMLHIPYNAGGPYLQSIMAGTVDVGIVGEGSGRTMGDKVHHYAITGNARIPRLPNTPTFAELGFPRISGPAYAVTVRAGTPKDVADRLTSATLAALQVPEVRAALERQLYIITPEDASGAQKKLANQVAFYNEFAQKIGLKPK